MVTGEMAWMPHYSSQLTSIGEKKGRKEEKGKGRRKESRRMKQRMTEKGVKERWKKEEG